MSLNLIINWESTHRIQCRRLQFCRLCRNEYGQTFPAQIRDSHIITQLHAHITCIGYISSLKLIARSFYLAVGRCTIQHSPIKIIKWHCNNFQIDFHRGSIFGIDCNPFHDNFADSEKCQPFTFACCQTENVYLRWQQLILFNSVFFN